MDYQNLFVTIAFIINFFLSILIFLRSPRTDANKSFMVTAFGITFWCMAMVLFRSSSSSTDILFAKFLYFFPTFIPTSFLLFGLYFSNQKINRAVLYSIIGINLVMAYLTLFTNTLIKDVIVPTNGEKEIVFGWSYYWMYIWYIPGFFTASYIVFFKKYLNANPYTKMQILYILGGMSAASIPAMITNLNMPTLGYFQLNWVGQVFTIFWISGVAYAIIKHRLMDIKLVVARAVVYSLLLIVIGALYSGVFFIIPASLLNITFSYSLLILFSVTTFIVALSFGSLKLIFQKITDNILYKNHYDTTKLLYDLALVMATTLELRGLESHLLDNILTQMKITRGSFILLNGYKNYTVNSEGYDTPPLFNEHDIEILISQRQLLIFDELSEGEIKEIMRRLNVSAVCYLTVKNEPIGVLMLGEKLSGDIYTPEDIQVLGTLAPEISVAIQNAKSYEEIRKFNITLQQEIQKATQDLQNANQRLKDLDHLKDDFVSVASHELRTPMTAIRSYVWMALHKPDMPLTEKLKRYLYRTLVSTERLITLVNDMLNVSRIEAGKIEIYPKPFDIVALVKDVMEEVKVKADEKLIKLQVLEQQIPQVFADPDKVHQVLLNLIGNSLKFTPPDGIISVGFFTDGQMIEVSIKDTGAGISKEDLAKLFHKFSRLDNSYVGMGTSGGTGLGLYISKSLIELMHGKIWARSDGENKGSIFTFSLPIATQDLINEAEKFHIKPKGEVKILEPVSI